MCVFYFAYICVYKLCLSMNCVYEYECVCARVYLHISGYLSFILNLIKKSSQNQNRVGCSWRLTRLTVTDGQPTLSQELYFGRDDQNKKAKSCSRSQTDDLYFYIKMNWLLSLLIFSFFMYVFVFSFASRLNDFCKSEQML